MKLESKLKALRTSGEQTIVEQIESSHPADWDMESAFEKSYQAYLQKSGESVPIHRSRHQAVFRTVAAAACLFLTVGLSVGVWSKQQQQKIETRPPKETTVTTITQTETSTKPKTEMSTVSSTTVPAAETSVENPETAATVSTAIAAVHTVPANTSQTTKSISTITGISENSDIQPKATYTETCITAQHTKPADTFPSVSKEETNMNQSTITKVQTTIAAVMTTAALVTTQPVITTAAAATTCVTLPGYVTRYGDVNLDQQISIMDMVKLQRYVLGASSKIDNWRNADLNNDNVIDIYDLAILKRGLIHDMEGIGGTMHVKLVDPATGKAPDTSAHINLLCFYHDEILENNDVFKVAQWDYTPGAVWEIRGLPTSSSYTYNLSISELEGGYGDQNGNSGSAVQVVFDGEAEREVTLEVTDQTPNVVFKQYDWALRSGMDDWSNQYYVMDYGVPVVTDLNGTEYECSIYGSDSFKLPDGTYHAEWKLPKSNAVQLVDPDSDFAKEIMAKNPDVVFTDQSKGIDFTVKDGKPDRSLQFNFMPVESANNQLTVNCIDSVTNEPIEGVKLSLILDPNGERKIVESWISDETGSKHFENLKISGYPSYMVQVDEIPEGYTGNFDLKTITAYWSYSPYRSGYSNGDSEEITLKFVPDAPEKNISIDIVNWEDKSLLNDLATYEILSDATNETVMSNVKAGEKISLPDGEYYAFLHGREFLDTEYNVISYRTVSGKKIFEEGNLSLDDFFGGNTAFIHFTVKDGKPDRDLVFYVKPHEPDDDVPVYEDPDYDQIQKYFYGVE